MTDYRGDRSPNRPRQDSPHRSARVLHPTTWGQYPDQQASTSSGLDNGKRKGEYREQRQNNDTRDKSQKRFKVFLDEYRIHLNDILGNDEQRKDIIKLCEQEFQGRNESEQKKYVEDLEDYMRKLQPDKYNDEGQIEIDKKLGYLLKNKDEALKTIRMSVLKFIEQKIENESNKKEAFLNWSTALDDYCTKHDKLVTDNVYSNVMKDVYLCYEENRSKIEKNKENNNYKGDNKGIYYAIRKFNESLYPRVERDQLFIRENRERARQDSQDLRAQLGDAEIQRQVEFLGQHYNHRYQQQQPERDHRPAQQPEHDHRQQQQLGRELPNQEQGQIQRFQQTPEQRLADLRAQGMGGLTSSQIREYSEILGQHRPAGQQEQLARRYEAEQLHSYIRRQQSAERPVSQALTNAYRVMIQWDHSLEQRGQELEQRIPELRRQHWGGLISSDLRRISGILEKQQEQMILRRRVSESFRKNLTSLREHLDQRLNSLQASGAPDRYESYGLTLDNLDRALKRTDKCLEKLRQYDQRRLVELRGQELRNLNQEQLREYSQLLDQQRPTDQQEQLTLYYEAERLRSHSRISEQSERLDGTLLRTQIGVMARWDNSYQRRGQELEQRIPELRRQRWRDLISSDLRRISGILEKQQEQMILRRRVSKSFRKNLTSLREHLDQRLNSLRASGEPDKYESYGLTHDNLDRALQRTDKCLENLRRYDQQRQPKRREMLKRMYSILRCVRPRVSE